MRHIKCTYQWHFALHIGLVISTYDGKSSADWAWLFGLGHYHYMTIVSTRFDCIAEQDKLLWVISFIKRLSAKRAFCFPNRYSFIQINLPGESFRYLVAIECLQKGHQDCICNKLSAATSCFSTPSFTIVSVFWTYNAFCQIPNEWLSIKRLYGSKPSAIFFRSPPFDPIKILVKALDRDRTCSV